MESESDARTAMRVPLHDLKRLVRRNPGELSPGLLDAFIGRIEMGIVIAGEYYGEGRCVRRRRVFLDSRVRLLQNLAIEFEPVNGGKIEKLPIEEFLVRYRIARTDPASE